MITSGVEIESIKVTIRCLPNPVVKHMRAHFYLAILTTVLCLTACGPDYKERYDTPLTYAQAMKEKRIDFPFPPSSHGIHYAMYGDWQAYQRLVRFEAPVEDCIRHIDAVLAWDDKVYNRTSSYPRINVTNVESHGGDVEMGPTPWFDVNNLKHGIYAGKDSSHTPEIWVDTDRGIFYFYETD